MYTQNILAIKIPTLIRALMCVCVCATSGIHLNYDPENENNLTMVASSRVYFYAILYFNLQPMIYYLQSE